MRILALGAHPDDIEIGCGATLMQMAKAGHRVTLIVATSGDKGGDHDIRVREQHNAAKMIDAGLVCGTWLDTSVPCDHHVVQAIETQLMMLRPDIVFVNSPHDTHQDHQNLARATITATRYMKNVLFYEGLSTLEFSPTVFMDITPMMDVKDALLRCHASQVNKVLPCEANINYIDVARATARHRGIQARVEYAEAFQALRYMLPEMVVSDVRNVVNDAEKVVSASETCTPGPQ